jgi:hypothetical protein
MLPPHISNESDAIQFLGYCSIQHYRFRHEFSPDGLQKKLCVDVDGDVNLRRCGLVYLPVQFGVVTGDFDCGYNDFEQSGLQGAPSEVGGDFICYNTKLGSLEGGPGKVGGDYLCNNNSLTSLKWAPHTVGGSFNCAMNNLTSLEQGPASVGDSYFCFNNCLTTLHGAPRKVHSDFNCDANKLPSLKDAPREIGSLLFCRCNPLEEIGAIFQCMELVADEEFLERLGFKGQGFVDGDQIYRRQLKCLMESVVDLKASAEGGAKRGRKLGI